MVEDINYIENIKNSQMKNTFRDNDIKKVAGIDIAYWESNGMNLAVCCIVVVDYNSKQILEKVHLSGEVNFPYIPGYLAFRELPLIIQTVKQLQNTPDLYMFDDNGYLHPRHMGIATHASFYLNKSTIGVAKSYYKICNVEYNLPDNVDGAYTVIVINGEIYGRVLRTHKDIKPIFISIGNYIDLQTVTNIVKHFITKESRIPIPTRIVDLETHKFRNS